MMSLSLRLLRRDWRAGELHVLLAAILVAVTCVTSVTFFTDRVGQALKTQSSELLGADLRMVADHPLESAVMTAAQSLGLAVAETRAFRSMILAGGQTKLAEIKAASDGYPLRGELRIAPGRFAPDSPTQALPNPGEAWVSPRLLQQLGLTVGDDVQVGNSRLRIAAVLSYEPDRSGDMFSIAPRLLMHLKDLRATGLEQEGSRIRYTLLLAGEQNAIAKFRRTLAPTLKRGERMEGVADARREVRMSLERAQQFLGLAAVVAVILACVAIAMAARRFAQRHLDVCAMMRCFGARQNQINRLFLMQLLMLGLIAGPLGVLLGFLAQAGLVNLLGPLILASLPTPSWTPAIIGLLVAVGGLLGFALPPILQLREVPILRVLRREGTAGWSSLRPLSVTSYLAGIAALSALVLFQAGDIKLGMLLILGLAGTAVTLWIVAASLVFGLKRLTGQGHSAWRFGLANLGRHTGMSIVQVMAFGVGIMVLLLLTLVRGDLLRGWADSLPTDAPNRFVISIQPEQRDAVQAFFDQAFAGDEAPAIKLFPMVRGRLVAINDEPVTVAGYADPRAKDLVEREFNLSWASKLQIDNAIVAGRWWGQAAHGEQLFSVEEGIARTLGIKLGDRLTYSIAGEKFTAEVDNLRSVKWDSFRANFFVLTPPGTLDAYPASYITSFYLPPDSTALLDSLVRQFPNLTVINIAALMDQIRQIIERVSLAVEYVFAFTLAAGLVVMVAAIQSTLDVRLRENAVLRALGARRRRLWVSLAAEFVTLGGLAGLLAALLASVLGYVIASQVLGLEYVINPWLWVTGLLVGGLGVGLAGIVGTRKVVNSPPLKVLQEI
jgi:putative ABC transport system permease protein